MDSDTIRDITNRTVQHIPEPSEVNAGSVVYFLAENSNQFEPFSATNNWQLRDKQLAEFWPKEPYLSSAIYSIASARAAFSFEVSGPPKTANRVLEILHSSAFNSGWISLNFQLAVSVLTQDNGGFLEVIRDKPRRGQKPENAPVIGLSVLSPSSCIRTGNPYEPVIYINELGNVNVLKWYEVVTFEDFPIPEARFRGRQMSFVSRVLRGAEIIKEIMTYKYEKVSGRFSRAIHLVGGVSRQEIDASTKSSQLNADNAGLMRYMEPIILPALDPNAKVSHVQIDMATLPDAFDEDNALKWYITLIAMAAGSDYQEFSPLPGGNLGSSSQSEILHRKSQAKGHALWMKLLEHKLQNSRVIPRNVSFRFMYQDAAAEADRVIIAMDRGKDRAQRIGSGEITPEVAQLMAVDSGDLKPEYLTMLGNSPSEEIILNDEDVISQKSFGENPQKLPITISAKAARTIRELLESHPFQSISPFTQSQLLTFEQALRNQLTHETVLGTDSYWQSRTITNAAYSSGIHPHLIRYRLPNDYRLILSHNKLSTNKGEVLHIHKPKTFKRYIKSNKSSGQVCYQCGNDAVSKAYRIQRGWLPVCSDHIGSELSDSMRDSHFENIEEISTAFLKQAEGLSGKKLKTLIVSTIAYSYVLGRNKEDHSLSKEEVNFIKNAAEKIVPFTDIVENKAVLTSMFFSYFKGRLNESKET